VNALKTISLAYVGSQCLAWYEHGVHAPCGGICRLEHGFCRAEARIMRDYESEMISKICEVSSQRHPVHNPRGECRRGCRERIDREGKRCVADDSPMKSDGITSTDIEVARHIMAMHSTTSMFERDCNALDANRSVCEAVEERCPEHYMPKYRGTWVQFERKGQGHAKADALPGMNGVLGHICSLIAEGPGFLDWLGEFLSQHPEDWKALLDAVITRDLDMQFGGFSDMLLGPPPDIKNPYEEITTPLPSVAGPGDSGPWSPGTRPPAGFKPTPPPILTTTTGDIDMRPALQAMYEDIGMSINHMRQSVPRLPVLGQVSSSAVGVGMIYVGVIAAAMWLYAILCHRGHSYRSQLQHNRRLIGHEEAMAPEMDDLEGFSE